MAALILIAIGWPALLSLLVVGLYFRPWPSWLRPKLPLRARRPHLRLIRGGL